jgi:serine/threonine protein kinase
MKLPGRKNGKTAKGDLADGPENSAEEAAREGLLAQAYLSSIDGADDELARLVQSGGEEASSAREVKTSVRVPTGNEPVQIGAGVVQSMIASGAMSRIYKTWNADLEEYRVIKLMLPTEQEDLRKRFITEAKISAKLRHTNIVTVYSTGEWEGLPYIEMEYVDGEPLSSLLRRMTKLPERVSLSIALGIARALAFAHSRKVVLYGKTYEGIVHRDLKPANVIISREGQVKLMDFGIAGPSDFSLHNTVSDGLVMGTFQYFSPEQMDGGQVDARSDIYAFGSVLYEMLSGQRAFPQTSITTLIKMKSLNQYRKLSEFDQHINKELQKIVDRCLERDRAKRFADAPELLEHLQKIRTVIPQGWTNTVTRDFISSKSAAPKETTKLLRLGETLEDERRKEKRRHRLLLAVAALGAVSLAAALLLRNRESLSMPAIRQAPASTVDNLEPVLASVKESMAKHHYTEAIGVLESLWVDHQSHPTVALYLLESYVATRETERAWEIIDREDIEDANFDLIAGYLEQKRGNTQKALEFFSTATQKISMVRDTARIRRDARYFAAMVLNKQYYKNKSPENRRKAIEAWEQVKIAYEDTPSHPRYKTADRMLASLLELIY